ncbi:hypothetical protein [Myroides sp.]|uniref:hypothetical protein n=1 Tax=Myroides sp. TaxID=1874736 RepID=UPI0028A96EDF|nr:hypothetical protein [Myroides sp.]
MKRKLIAFSLFLLTQSIFSQNEQRMLEQANVCFDEFKHAAEQHKSLWDIDLYGPLFKYRKPPPLAVVMFYRLCLL